MLRRCTARPSICPRLRLHPRPPPRETLRFQSTTAEQGQSSSSHNTSKPPSSRKWQLYVVGGLIGFTIGSWYRIINRAGPRETFQKFELVEKVSVSSTASVFTLKPKGKVQTDELAAAWKQGIWNVEFKQPQLQIVRAYTPLPPVDDVDVMDDEPSSTLRFLIRRDERGGEMSSYLHRLGTGAEIELRGPNVEYQVTDDMKNVVFVAGGTGIAPAMQVAHAMFDGLSERQKREKSLHILWGCRRREDCEGGRSDGHVVGAVAEEPKKSGWGRLFTFSKQESARVDDLTSDKSGIDAKNLIVKELEELKALHGNNIEVSYFVDDEKSYITTDTLKTALASINPVAREDVSSKTQVIISGPPGFITYLAGPKVWQDGKEQQGPLGGRLAQVLGKDDREDVKVYKV